MFSLIFICCLLPFAAFGQSSPSQYRPSQYSPSQYSPSQYSSSSAGSAPRTYSAPSQLSAAPASAPQYSSQSSSATTLPKRDYPPASVHYVNIGADLAGDYKFGYDTGKGPEGQSFREETRLPDGTVKGAYGYIDANGQQRIVRYTAGKEGFVVDSDGPAGGSAAPRPAPQPTYSAQPTYSSQPLPQTYSAPRPIAAAPPSYSSAPRTISSAPLPSSYSSAPRTISASSLPSTYSAPRTISAPSYQSPSRALGSSSLGSYGTAGQPEEETTYGPPVINTALLSYNIGSQG